MDSKRGIRQELHVSMSSGGNPNKRRKQNPTSTSSSTFSSAVSNAWNNSAKGNSSSTPPVLKRSPCLFCSNFVILRENLGGNSSSQVEKEELVRGTKLKTLCNHMGISSCRLPPRCPPIFCKGCEDYLEQIWFFHVEHQKFLRGLSKAIYKVQKKLVWDEFANQREGSASAEGGDVYLELRNTIIKDCRTRIKNQSQRKPTSGSNNSCGPGMQQHFGTSMRNPHKNNGLGLGSNENLDETTSEDEDGNFENYEEEIDELPVTSPASTSASGATILVKTDNKNVKVAASIVTTTEDAHAHDVSSSDEDEEGYEQGREEFGGDGEIMTQTEVETSGEQVNYEVSDVGEQEEEQEQGVDEREEEMGAAIDGSLGDLNNGNNDEDMDDREGGEENEVQNEEQVGPSNAPGNGIGTLSLIEIKRENTEEGNQVAIAHRRNENGADPNVDPNVVEVWSIEARKRRYLIEGIEIYKVTGARPGLKYMQCSLCAFSVPLSNRKKRDEGQMTAYNIMKGHIINIHKKKTGGTSRLLTNPSPRRGPGRPATQKTCKVCKEIFTGHRNLEIHMKTHNPNKSALAGAFQRKVLRSSRFRRFLNEDGNKEATKRSVEPGSKEELLGALGMSPKRRDGDESSD
ncbi:unnamed protein product [Orchesella dallaii]|uniref:C2H2-type domain-containing protein n=1 Tax=Orchesella dallaii TaxID=48710 RepID=A0ABP1R777_9HEXA